MPDARLSSLEDAVAATLEAFGESTQTILLAVLSYHVPMVAGEKGGDC